MRLIANRGQGVLESGVIVDPLDPQGTVWIQRPTPGEEEVWQRLRPGDVSPRLRLAPREHLVAAFGEWIWVVQLDDFDVPTVTGRRVLLESEEKQ